MIGELILNYKELGAFGIFILMMSWYLRYQTKRQAKREDKHDEQQEKDRTFYRNLVTTDMKEIHKDNLKNTELNSKSIVLIKDMNKNLKEHNGHSKSAWEKTINSLGIIADRLNGGSDAGMAVKKELERYKQRGIVDRRELNKKVSVERRK